MTDTVIRVENLGKQYRIGVQEKAPQSLRQAVTNFFGSPFKYLSTVLRPPTNEEIVWALKDVSFEVKQGEVIGVIGRNGAGKSTLLKILSRITEPTTGYAEIRGRVASLLEVGAGFHPELTGRENIYLNGTIMGMKKREIDRRFDEIVDFAGVEKYIDTPVKRYSSGMHVRLAFSVAAYLEPEILVVDEVLAVGDASFQQKCMGKMNDVATKDGRTILFVSHNMGAVTALCSSSILINSGTIYFTGSPHQAIAHYLQQSPNDGSGEVLLSRKLETAYFTRVAVLDESNQPTVNIEVNSSFRIRLEYTVEKLVPGLDAAFSIFDNNGSRLFYSSISRSLPAVNLEHQIGNYRFDIEIPKHFLTPGTYSISNGLYIANQIVYDKHDMIMRFSIIESGSRDYSISSTDIGSIFVDLNWKIVNH